MVQAPAPARIVEGGIPTEALIVQVRVAKYADHVDGYGGYAALARHRQQIRLALCWAHVRRKF